MKCDTGEGNDRSERRKVVYFLSLFYPCAYVLRAFSGGMVAPFYSL